MEQDLCQEHPHCRDCHAPAFAAQALPCPTSAGGCPRARAVLARCPVAPLDPHPAEVMVVSAWMLPQPRASVSPILPQLFHGAQPAHPAPGASQPHTGTPPPIPIPCPAETTCPWPLAPPSWAAWGSPAPCWALQDPTVGLSPPGPMPAGAFPWTPGWGVAAPVCVPPACVTLHPRKALPRWWGVRVLGCQGGGGADPGVPTVPVVPPRRTRGSLRAHSRTGVGGASSSPTPR